VAAASAENRATVLERFRQAYGAQLALYRFEAEPYVGPALALPPVVKERLEAARMGWRPFGFGPGRGFGFRGGPGGENFRDGGPREKMDKQPRREPPPDEPGFSRKEKGGPPPEPRPELPPEMGREREHGRFVVRAGSPPSFWVGMRVGFPERSRPGPALMLVRIDSFWALLRFLDLESWLLGGAGALALSVVFWLPLVHSITRSLRQLTAATERIAEGRFDTRVPAASRRDEIGQLGHSVNRMASRLDAHMHGQRKFLGDVAHELCSPLARLQMASGILEDQAPPALRATISDVREEVQQMSTLVNELLAFTKAGLQPREVELKPLALGELVRDAVARENAAEQVTLAVPADLQALADPHLLSRALANLVRNAVRYAGAAGPILVTARREDRLVIVAVDDHGPGVPAEALDRLGEPFFRPELARTRESGGVGLGLSIVRSAVLACGGEVRFANRTPRGFHAELRLKAP
jgi:two-component system sensor histidine kinase CpxA